MKKYCNKEDIIVDATSGMGGDSMYFCKYFSYVYCIDVLPESIQYIEHNLNNYDNKFIINHDCNEILKIIKYDIVYLDPPWGGYKYKYNKYLTLKLNDIDICNIIEQLYFKCNIVALKCPINFRINEYNKENLKYNIINLWKIRTYNIYKNDNTTIIFKLIIFIK